MIIYQEDVEKLFTGVGEFIVDLNITEAQRQRLGVVLIKKQASKYFEKDIVPIVEIERLLAEGKTYYEICFDFNLNSGLPLINMDFLNRTEGNSLEQPGASVEDFLLLTGIDKEMGDAIGALYLAEHSLAAINLPKFSPDQRNYAWRVAYMILLNEPAYVEFEIKEIENEFLLSQSVAWE